MRNTRPHYFAANDDARESALSGWHANLLLIQRRHCILFVHDSTRFPVFLPALKKDDFANLDDWFSDGFMNTLLKTGTDDKLMQHAQAMLAPLQCDSECNRSVQGTMNQMAQSIKFDLEYDNISVADITGYRLGARLAERPCMITRAKDCIWPIKAMHELILSA